MKSNNFSEVHKKLSELPKKLRNKALRNATKDAAKAVAAEARKIAPEATGELSKSVKVRAAKRSRTRIGAIVASTDPKAIHLEYGTSDTKEQAFLRPALESKEREAINIIISSIKRNL